MSSKTKTTTTKEEARPALVPKLRFPEFRGTAGWQSGQLKDSLATISNGLALEQSSGTSGYRVTRIETISAGNIDLAKVGLVQTSEDISAYKLRVGDILLSNINSVAHIGKSVFVDRDYGLYHGMNLLRLEVNRSQHDPKFIFYAINTDGVRASLRERANKAVNQASINQTELGKTEVSLPLIPEQQKIAECLSSVDELIAAQARKVDALKTHKKGLMQQLFPREGETQPRLRFPEFQNAGEWEVQRLDELANYENGKAHENDIAEYGRYIVVNSKFISTEGAVRKFSNQGFCVADEGNVLMVLSDVPNGRAIAKCYFVGSDNLYTVNQRICRIQPTKANGKFLFYILDRNAYFLDFDDGIKQTNLRKEDVLGCPLCVATSTSRTTPHRLVPEQPRRPDHLRNPKARSPQDSQERTDAAAFSIPGGGVNYEPRLNRQGTCGR